MKSLDYLLPLLILSFSVTCTDWSPIDKLITQSIQTHVFPGAIISISNTTHILYQKQYGHLSYGPDIYSLFVRNQTKYDIASLTKVMATTWAIMSAVSGGRMKVDDLVSKYIVNYDSNKKTNTTIKNLLLHNSGLPSDYIGQLPKTQDQLIDYIRFIKPNNPVGTKYQYSNLGFLLLGKIIQVVTNKSLDWYTTQNNILAGLKNTGFNPNQSEYYKIAPTQYDEQRMVIGRGQAHQRIARFFNGVAGHSGYFSTVGDLIRFMRILLNDGQINGEIRVLPAALIQQFTTRVTGLPYQNKRALGFDTECPCQKMKNCYGHDGSTGTSAWVDLDRKIAYVILSNRGHPDVKNNRYFDEFKQKFCQTILETLGEL